MTAINQLEMADWERRLADLWSRLADHEPDDFVRKIDILAAELPQDSAIGPFERASAFDSTGRPAEAVPLYRRALDLGLTGLRRRRAVVQLASSLRNLGQFGESISLLSAERTAPPDELDDAVAAFLALALVDAGRAREAAAIALRALAPHLVRYQQSLARYADALVSDDD